MDRNIVGRDRLTTTGSSISPSRRQRGIYSDINHITIEEAMQGPPASKISGAGAQHAQPAMRSVARPVRAQNAVAAATGTGAASGPAAPATTYAVGEFAGVPHAALEPKASTYSIPLIYTEPVIEFIYLKVYVSHVRDRGAPPRRVEVRDSLYT
jgi:hypothetical protein